MAAAAGCGGGQSGGGWSFGGGWVMIRGHSALSAPHPAVLELV